VPIKDAANSSSGGCLRGEDKNKKEKYEVGVGVGVELID
jgi:hypothetical protein